MSQEVQLLLATLLGDREVIAYRPALARALGSPLAALFLSQAAHWQSVAGAGEWWFKLRDADRDRNGGIIPPSNRARQSWEWETGLGRADQESARRLLKGHGLLEECRRGVPARLYYRVDLVRLEKFLLAYRQMGKSDHPDGENPPSGWRDGATKVDAIQPTISQTTSKSKALKTTTTAHGPKGQAPLDGTGQRGGRIEDNFLARLEIEPAIHSLRQQLLQILERSKISDFKLAQDLLDELAGTIEAAKRGERRPIALPTAWLRQLVRKAREENFDRVYCYIVQRRRAATLRESAAFGVGGDKAKKEMNPETARTELGKVKRLLKGASGGRSELPSVVSCVFASK
jgi:hypothetical protein